MSETVQVAGLTLTVRGYQFPDAADYWDGNWLVVEAALSAPGCRVAHSGPFLRTDEFARFETALASLDAGDGDAAAMTPMEPDLALAIAREGSLGALSVTVELSPDRQTQAHRVTFAGDRSDLPRLRAELRAVLSRFPVRGDRDV